MEYNPDRHHRCSIRLKGYDYSEAGAYFVTICAQNRECLFGEIRNGGMMLNEYGEIVRKEWMNTGIVRSYVELDEYVVMPNHFHGILVINGRGTACRVRHENVRDESMGTARRVPMVEQFAKPVAGSIPTIIRSFKSAVTKSINQFRNTPGHPVWQRNYYEHIIRSEEEMYRICRYIIENPAKWAEDEDNPENIHRSGMHAMPLQATNV
jgi:REP element-mobilizing transposase RayT